MVSMHAWRGCSSKGCEASLTTAYRADRRPRKRLLQHSSASVLDSHGCRVLDPPLSQSMTASPLTRFSRGQRTGYRSTDIGHRKRLGDDVMRDGVEAVSAFALIAEAGAPPNRQV